MRLPIAGGPGGRDRRRGDRGGLSGSPAPDRSGPGVPHAAEPQRLVEALHLTGATVSRALVLLDLPCAAQEAVNAGALAPSVAHEVSKLEDPEVRREVAGQIVAKALGRAEATEAARRRAGGPARARPGR